MSDILKKTGSTVTQNTGDAKAAEDAQAKLDQQKAAEELAAKVEAEKQSAVLREAAEKQAAIQKAAEDQAATQAKIDAQKKVDDEAAAAVAVRTQETKPAEPGALFSKSLDDLGFNEPLTVDDENEEALGDDEIREPIDCFRHRNIKRFKVGEFEFVNNLLFVYSEEERDRFLHLHRTLEPIDKNNIVRFNYRAVQNLESSINERSLVRRGALSTGRIRDPKVISN